MFKTQCFPWQVATTNISVIVPAHSQAQKNAKNFTAKKSPGPTSRRAADSHQSRPSAAETASFRQAQHQQLALFRLHRRAFTSSRHLGILFAVRFHPFSLPPNQSVVLV